ncbi:MAG TPA: transcription-repair coupling factor [Mollicutes bacterium]|nr:transcription-repair coupling factor [Mollicutes bacterium]
MNEIYNKIQLQNYENIYGLTDELKAIYISNHFKEKKENIIVLTSSVYETTKYYNLIKTHCDDVLFFPSDDFLTSVVVAASPEFETHRITTLSKINNNNNKKYIVVTNLTGFLKHLPKKESIKDIVLKVGQDINRDKLIEKLDSYGYYRESLVTSTGEYSVRGFIIDIFPLKFNSPVRIELFGDTIESIREFNYDTQLSINDLKEISITPYKENLSEGFDSLHNILNNPFVFKIENDLINKTNELLESEIHTYKMTNDIDEKLMFNLSDINIKKYQNLNDFGTKKDSFNFSSEKLENFGGDINLFKEFILSKHNKYNLYFVTNKEKVKQNILNLSSNIKIINGNINEGFIINNDIFISEHDLEKKIHVSKVKSNLKIGTKIKDFSDINKGDYVVHRDHGIGIYNGVVTLKHRGFKKDYLLINYSGEDKVYVPVEKITTIYKYTDKEGSKPKLHSLASTKWERTKAQVKKKIKDISEDLLKLYSKRLEARITPFITFKEELDFASEFEYVETEDQIKCINEIDKDLTSSVPMDRLLCGDVGFGKTEVAFRAMFKTVMNTHQVAYLCPTTILSKQQYESAKKRFTSFNFNIVLLNRFTTPKETKNIISGLKCGKIDIVIGTHKLLNEKIEYNNLGLLIIDEEQRFGVLQKERVKNLKNNVNILTLSATPIPRTLKMSMSGLKDLSIIDTPPESRYPVQTYVVEENDLLIKDIIYKEISRSGQVYILYNNVSKIDIMTDRIKRLVPDVKIKYAHGQMPKRDLESTIEAFINHEFDCLVCSTIIETGIDISNVNSLIIIDAQNYGLSQLYQLRGRVGRSDKIAYAYLMYDKNKVLTESAVKRLKSIKEFTQLGSGYKIALRDLSIRGAGDLLGSEQAGFIDSVGYHLYTDMIKETLDELKGIKRIESESNHSLIDVDTHISPDYVSDENIRIEIHNLINKISDFHSLTKVKNEIIDRFGKFDDSLEIYMYEEWFEKLCLKLNINRINQTSNLIEVYLPKDISDKIDGEKLFLETYTINSNFKIRYQRNEIIISLNLKNLKKHYIFDFVKLINKIKNQLNKNE